MAEYTIECEQCLGISHDGAVYADGEGTVELSDEEVTTLVQLIHQKGTTDVGELDLETTHPDLYAKLDKAYHDMAQHAETMHWLWEGYEQSSKKPRNDQVVGLRLMIPLFMPSIHLAPPSVLSCQSQHDGCGYSLVMSLAFWQ